MQVDFPAALPEPVRREEGRVVVTVGGVLGPIESRALGLTLIREHLRQGAC
jgi:hypothetical protein